MANKELIDRVDKKMRELVGTSWGDYTAGEFLAIIAEEIKNMKLPETLPEKPTSGYEMMFRRRHDIKVQGEYGRVVRNAILDLLESGMTNRESLYQHLEEGK